MPRKFSLTRSDILAARSFRRRVGTSLSLSYGVLPRRTIQGGAIVVSKKVEKRAVGRNKMKRALRPVLSSYLQVGACPSVIVSIRKKAESPLLVAELRALLGQISPLT